MLVRYILEGLFGCWHHILGLSTYIGSPTVVKVLDVGINGVPFLNNLVLIVIPCV